MTDKRIRMDCPFCHTPPERIELKGTGTARTIDRFWFVECPECGVRTAIHKNKQEAVNSWNRR